MAGSSLFGHHPHSERNGRAFSRGILGESVLVCGPSGVCRRGGRLAQRPLLPPQPVLSCLAGDSGSESESCHLPSST